MFSTRVDAASLNICCANNLPQPKIDYACLWCNAALGEAEDADHSAFSRFRRFQIANRLILSKFAIGLHNRTTVFRFGIAGCLPEYWDARAFSLPNRPEVEWEEVFEALEVNPDTPAG